MDGEHQGQHAEAQRPKLIFDPPSISRETWFEHKDRNYDDLEFCFGREDDHEDDEEYEEYEEYEQYEQY